MLWIKRHAALLGYIYITIGFVVCLGLIQHNSDVARTRDCLNRQGGRQTLRNVILVATTPRGGGVRIDLTVVPGFNDLDEVTQTFFRNLSEATGSSSTPPVQSDQIPAPDPNNSLQALLLQQAPPIRCSGG